MSESDSPQPVASEAEIDALEYVVHQGIIGAYDRPVLLAWLARLQRTPAEPSTPGEGTLHSECPYVTGTVTRYCTLTPFTLTDAEREAIAWFAEAGKPLARLTQSHNREQYRATLRGLLERTR
jgi:hypothetical protein